jgi:hypothetical protein
VTALVAVPTTAAEAIAAVHRLRPPRNLSEALTEATLLGLELDTRDPGPGTTLRDRLTAFWAAPGRPSRPPTPFLDAWQRCPTPVGTPLWKAAAWEQSALNAFAQGCSAETVARDLAEVKRIATECPDLAPAPIAKKPKTPRSRALAGSWEAAR